MQFKQQKYKCKLELEVLIKGIDEEDVIENLENWLLEKIESGKMQEIFKINCAKILKKSKK